MLIDTFNTYNQYSFFTSLVGKVTKTTTGRARWTAIQEIYQDHGLKFDLGETQPDIPFNSTVEHIACLSEENHQGLCTALAEAGLGGNDHSTT